MHYMWNYVEYSKFGAPIHPELKSPFKVLRAPKKKTNGEGAGWFTRSPRIICQFCD